MGKWKRVERDSDLYGDNVRVRTTWPESTNGMLVALKHLDARRPWSEGTLAGFVPGHGGDVWYVKHDDGAVGVYTIREFEVSHG